MRNTYVTYDELQNVLWFMYFINCSFIGRSTYIDDFWYNTYRSRYFEFKVFHDAHGIIQITEELR